MIHQPKRATPIRLVKKTSCWSSIVCRSLPKECRRCWDAKVGPSCVSNFDPCLQNDESGERTNQRHPSGLN